MPTSADRHILVQPSKGCHFLGIVVTFLGMTDTNQSMNRMNANTQGAIPLLIKPHIERDFSNIYETYYRDVYQFLFCCTGNKNDAEDLTQEVFLQVISALSRFEGRSQIKTWILGIAKNVLRSWFRKRRFSQFFKETFLRNLETTEGCPEPELMFREEAKEVVRALQKLKAEYRMVIILRCVKECSVKETADILGCSEAKVKVDFHRACKKLQEHLHPRMRGEWANELVN
jgi:RNA polymerase sigma-70 factor (ECF subfamily)